MIAADYLKRIAAWSRELTGPEIEIARAGIVEKSYSANEFIFLRGDQNTSDTSLMAHELRHVEQQSSGGVGSGGSGMTVGAADDSHEHDADAVAQQVVAGVSQRKQEESPAG